MNHLAIHLKLTQHCTSTVLKKKKEKMPATSCFSGPRGTPQCQSHWSQTGLFYTSGFCKASPRLSPEELHGFPRIPHRPFAVLISQRSAGLREGQTSS